MTLFSNKHNLTFLCFMQKYQGKRQNLLEVWSFKSSSTTSKGKWKNRCNSKASCCQKKHETTDMFSLSLLFSSFVSWTAPGCPHGSLGVFKHLCYLHLENLCVPMKPFLFPYCLIFCCNLQTVVTPNKALEYFSFSSLIFSLQLSCLYNFIIFHCHILFFPFYLWSLGDI